MWGFVKPRWCKPLDALFEDRLTLALMLSSNGITACLAYSVSARTSASHLKLLGRSISQVQVHSPTDVEVFEVHAGLVGVAVCVVDGSQRHQAASQRAGEAQLSSRTVQHYQMVLRRMNLEISGTRNPVMPRGDMSQ